MNTMHSKLPESQRGAVLVVSLIILLVLTLIGISAMQTTALEERMAGNLRSKTIALQAAELAIAEAEFWIGNQTARPTPVSTCGSPPCNLWEVNSHNYMTLSPANWLTQGRQYSGAIAFQAGATVSAANRPRFIIEEQSFVPDSLVVGAKPPTGKWYYRISARGTDSAAVGQSAIQASYARRY